MNINEIFHILRASKGISGEDVFVLLGSQAVLVQYHEIPKVMANSQEVDIYPRFRPEMSELLAGVLGEDSVFHHTFGFYADGVGPETAILPPLWESRAIVQEGTAQTAGATAIAPEIHDLAVSKLYAGREKDLTWISSAIDAGYLQEPTLKSRLDELINSDTNEPKERLDLAATRLGYLFKGASLDGPKPE